MQITMQIEGQEKTFSTTFISARMFRKALEIAKTFENKGENDFSVSDLDMMVEYVVDLFAKQFTLDQLYDGIAADKLMPTLVECIRNVTASVGNQSAPKNA